MEQDLYDIYEARRAHKTHNAVSKGFPTIRTRQREGANENVRMKKQRRAQYCNITIPVILNYNNAIPQYHHYNRTIPGNNAIPWHGIPQD